MTWTLSNENGTVVIDQYTYIVQAQMGAGAPPLRNVVVPFATHPGGHITRIRVETRTLALQILAKGTTVAHLHQLRRRLIDLVRPDQAGTAPLTVTYSGGSIPLTIGGVYDGGLELTTPSLFVEPISLRLLAADPPLWQGEAQSVSSDVAMSVVDDPLGYGVYALPPGGLPTPLITVGDAAAEHEIRAAVAARGTLWLGGRWAIPGVGTFGVIGYTAGGSVTTFLDSELDSDSSVHALAVSHGNNALYAVIAGSLQGMGPGLAVHQGGSWTLVPGTYAFNAQVPHSLLAIDGHIIWNMQGGTVQNEGITLAGIVERNPFGWARLMTPYLTTAAGTVIRESMADLVYRNNHFFAVGDLTRGTVLSNTLFQSNTGLAKFLYNGPGNDQYSANPVGQFYVGLGQVVGSASGTAVNIVPKTAADSWWGALVVVGEAFLEGDGGTIFVATYQEGNALPPLMFGPSIPASEMRPALRVAGTSLWLIPQLAGGTAWHYDGRSGESNLWSFDRAGRWTPAPFWPTSAGFGAGIIDFAGTPILFPGGTNGTMFTSGTLVAVVAGQAAVTPQIRISDGAVSQIVNLTNGRRAYLSVTPRAGETLMIRGNTVTSTWSGWRVFLFSDSSQGGITLLPGTNILVIQGTANVELSWTTQWWSSDL